MELHYVQCECIVSNSIGNANKGNRMGKFFDVLSMTTKVSDYKFAGNQESISIAHGVVRVFRTKYIAGDVSKLPDYIKSSVQMAGYKMIYLGVTTYDHSLIGLTEINHGTGISQN